MVEIMPPKRRRQIGDLLIFLALVAASAVLYLLVVALTHG